VNLSDDGNTLNNTKSLSLSKQANPSIINIFDKKQHNFGSAGQTHLKSLILPQDLQVYEQILLHIDLDCPAEGCDPWDQPANISIIKDGQEFEIARYITPYRKACGPWTVDITDFKSLLGGATTFKSYIQVFGPSGWLLNLDIELIPSAAGFTYNKLSPLWNNQYIVYGDPGISYNLPVIQNPIEENTLSSHLRITLSGHGQGNTNNAAEFSNRTHEIIGNNFTIANHNLWKNDCEFNTCADQFGTWEFDRAGWCPGQAVDPFILNTTSNFNAGGQAFLDYKFEPYTNLLNSGYNGAGHTEPHYRMASYLIQSSNERFEDYTNLNITSIKVATDSSNANVEFGPVTVEVKNEGNAAVENPILAYYLNNTLVVEETLNQSIAPGETVTYNFINVGDFVEGQDYLVIGSVELANDENLDDNLIATFLNGNTTSRNEFIHKDAIQVYPNPSTGSFTVLSQDINMEEIVIFDLNGQIIYNNIIQQETFDFEIPTSGIYILTIKGDNQKIFRQKLVVIE
jgi:hypothetical protein